MCTCYNVNLKHPNYGCMVGVLKQNAIHYLVIDYMSDLPEWNPEPGVRKLDSLSNACCGNALTTQLFGKTCR